MCACAVRWSVDGGWWLRRRCQWRWRYRDGSANCTHVLLMTDFKSEPWPSHRLHFEWVGGGGGWVGGSDMVGDLRGGGGSDGGIGGRGDSGDNYENKRLYPHLPRRGRCGGVLTTPA